MHALVIAIGSHGDVHPMLGIATALRERGHRVSFVTSPYFESLVRKAGFDLVPLGTAEQFKTGLANQNLWHPLRAFKAVFLDHVMPGTRPLYDAIVAHAISGETVVVAHSLAFGARLAQEKHGFPTATVHLAPAIFRTVHDVPAMGGVIMRSWWPTAWKRAFWWVSDKLMLDRVLLPPLNAIRAELRLPPVRRGVLDDWWHSPQLIVGLFPDWFGAPQPDWPKQVRLTGFPLYDERDVEPVSPELEQFLAAGDPPIAFTPGSAMTFGQSFFRESVKACEILGRRGILLSRHREHIPTDLPPTVRHFDYAPFSRILPRCAALVHHGGVGTTSQALAAGIPQLIMPMAHDQFDNAARVARLGVGAPIARSRYRAKNVAAKLNGLLADRHVAGACRQVANRINGVDAVGQACDLIEQLARDRLDSRGTGSQPVPVDEKQGLKAHATS
jgi:UDP:flavonoid glycosyltransferase YjiC (YdhE family)